jgi:hypothetical protein
MVCRNHGVLAGAMVIDKPLQRSNFAKERSSGGGTPTPDTRIMIHPAPPENPGENVVFGTDAAQDAARNPTSGPIDANLAKVISAWPTLSDAVKAEILAMVSTG